MEGDNDLETQDFKDLKRKAESGEVEAQVCVSYRLYYAFGCVADRRKAQFWCLKACEKGNQTALGIKYISGFDCKVDKAKRYANKIFLLFLTTIFLYSCNKNNSKALSISQKRARKTQK